MVPRPRMATGLKRWFPSNIGTGSDGESLDAIIIPRAGPVCRNAFGACNDGQRRAVWVRLWAGFIEARAPLQAERVRTVPTAHKATKQRRIGFDMALGGQHGDASRLMQRFTNGA